MSDERGEEARTVQSPPDQSEETFSSVGQRWVGRNYIILLAVYLVLITVALIWGIVQLWPPPMETSGTSQADSGIKFLFWTLTISAEAHLILIVIIASAIGAQSHALRSLYWYVGNRKLTFSWLMRYFMMPFAGITLGLAFYFVIRGGFFAAGTEVEDLSAYGFTAMAFLVGMFTDQAAERLKKVAEALFAKPGVGINSYPPKERDS